MLKIHKILFLLSFLLTFCLASSAVSAQSPTPTLAEGEEATESAQVATPTVTPMPRTDLTQETKESVEPLRKILDEQELGSVWPFNPIKYAIRGAISVGVPPNTIVLLLLLPVVASIIAAARHLIGIRGFGIFLPAALSVVFVAIGPVVGIGIFLVIVTVSIVFRMFLRKTKVKLQYLPRMALILHFVVLGVLMVLFAAPVIRNPDLTNVSIFPILILVLLAEDFSRVQLGKSARTAINLTTETLILALVCFVFLTSKTFQSFALLKPEVLIIFVTVFNFFLGKYVGLRLVEYWKFRRLVTG